MCLYSILNFLSLSEWICKLVNIDNFWFILSKNGLLPCTVQRQGGRHTEVP